MHALMHCLCKHASRLQLLGRADIVKDFIRRGETEALIEITLASGEAKPIVVSRRIKTAKDSGGTSDWKLNGAGCSEVGES